ncbi:MAG: hypothetical protein Q8R28_11400 [Dehalococcoidia bacterium]|nr:hypothetical protein [Dehalococcoidia bacterium]
MSYACECGYDGAKGWVVARTTRDWALATPDGDGGWEYSDEVAPNFPDSPMADRGDAELTPAHHLSCPACGLDVEESDFWPIEPEEKETT